MNTKTIYKYILPYFSRTCIYSRFKLRYGLLLMGYKVLMAAKALGYLPFIPSTTLILFLSWKNYVTCSFKHSQPHAMLCVLKSTKGKTFAFCTIYKDLFRVPCPALIMCHYHGYHALFIIFPRAFINYIWIQRNN